MNEKSQKMFQKLADELLCEAEMMAQEAMKQKEIEEKQKKKAKLQKKNN